MPPLDLQTILLLVGGWILKVLYEKYAGKPSPTPGPVDPNNPVELAEAYAWYINEYQKTEVKAFESGAKAPAKDVPEEDINDVALDKAADTIKESLGATEIEDGAPWDQPSNETTTKKDWDVSDDDWDFS